MTTNSSIDTKITAQEVLRLFWEAYKYPIIGNEDLRISVRMENEALGKASIAVSCPNDPPEFKEWLERLQNPKITSDEKDQVYWDICDYFDPIVNKAS
jgi:hypothetical protein